MKYISLHPTRYVLILLVVAIAVFGLAVGCFDTGQNPTEPAEITQPGVLFNMSSPQVQGAMAVQNRHTPELMANPEVVGTATGLDKDGHTAVIVLLKSRAGAKAIPKTLDGVPVVVEVTGPIHAYKGKPGGGANHTARQTRPIQLGVSGGNAYDLANGYCCSGTLGALVAKGGSLYILSNSHVLCGDIASSAGDPDVAKIGDPIDQPGLVDVSCQDRPSDYVANLSTLTSLVPPTNVDCAIAKIISGMVRTDGSILEIGTISSQTVSASIRQKVKKSGRTSGLTRGKVTGLNATVNVGYEDECNGNSFTVLYTGQILIGGGLSQPGDSGSLVVEDVNNNPRAVGLLYAGGGGTTVANPIDEVLSYLGATLVGN
jgi:hypothetical protein